MKTTVEIPDDLLREAKDMATAENTTLRALIEEGLRRVLSRRRSGEERFVLRDAGVEGRGVKAGLTEGKWDDIQDLIYRGRGS